ncbi:hypothetical protein [Flammeovirga pacifica]|uniref:Phage portal protein n=1 Tax=Flammeovirga pacifica TaxID=915059 RepID=A0A1S1Z279_FLAPC|nr:hypothetical protein [Flammeovirga pacifica]OHX67376.1 hypothetical protein NH26_13995 [Flammeovirga pacifica]
MKLSHGFVGSTKMSTSYTDDQKKFLRKQKSSKKNTTKHVPYGDADDLPNHLIELVGRSSIMPGLSEFWEGVWLGDGFKTYQKIVENGKIKTVEFFDQELQDWLDSSRAEEVILDLLPDFWATGNAYCQLVFTKGNKVDFFFHNEVVDCRVTEKDKDGLSKYIVIDSCFDTANTEVSEETHRQEVANIKTNEKKAIQDKRGVFHIFRKKAGKRYYGLPVWWSEETEKALNVSHSMFTFKDENLENSINAKYHIELFNDYFKEKYGAEKTEEEIKEIKHQLVKDVHSNITNPENAGKTLWTDFTIDKRTGEKISAIKISLIPNDLKDDAYSKAIDQISGVLAMTTNTNPGLADLIVGGKLGGDTGSAVRESYNVTGKTKTKINRSLLLKPFNWAIKHNFPHLKNVYIDFASFQLTTTDKVKSGVQDTSPNKTEDQNATTNNGE